MTVSLVAAAAVITATPDYWQATDHWAVVQPSQASRTCSPAAAYARDAAALLPNLASDTAMICVMGATGMTADVFAKARTTDRLVDADFGRKRYKRIHPFTLVRSLQNQAASELSMHFGYQGPCLNFIDGEAGLAQIPLHVKALLARCRHVLLVFTSAPDRSEESGKCAQLVQPGVLAEGAAAFLFAQADGLGYLETTTTKASSGGLITSGGVPVVTPVVRVGWQLFQRVHAQQAGGIALRDGPRQQVLHWRPF